MSYGQYQDPNQSGSNFPPQKQPFHSTGYAVPPSNQPGGPPMRVHSSPPGPQPVGNVVNQMHHMNIAPAGKLWN